LHPASGQPIAVPSQDIVLGCYYLTAMKATGKGAGKLFADVDEAIRAYEEGVIELHVPVKIRLNGELVETSVGRAILNQAIPEELGFLNKTFDKKTISQTVDRYFRIAGNEKTGQLLDRIKETGFKWATRGGMSISIADMIIPPEKYEMIRETKAKADN